MFNESAIVTVVLRFCASILATILAVSSPALAQSRPDALLRQLPGGYRILTLAVAPNVVGHDFYLVALASVKEAPEEPYSDTPPRPLLIFERDSAGRFKLVARNDRVVLRGSDGGLNGCDPFGDRHIAVRGRYFTVEHGVSCGPNHWSDYITFRFDASAKSYVFDNRHFTSMVFNASRNPDAEALIPGPHSIVRADRSHLVRFSDWRPRD